MRMGLISPIVQPKIRPPSLTSTRAWGTRGMEHKTHRYVHMFWVAVLWIIFTAAAEAALLVVDLLPPPATVEGEKIDGAFRHLTVVAAPVFSFVLAVLLYCLVRFRSRGAPQDDGPPLQARPAIVGVWLAITAGLAVYVMINPGLIGLAELRAHAHDADLVVHVEGMRWRWKVAYPSYNVTSTSELVLPVHRRTRVEVTATDVVHSFWVPAFRMKIDAVPGLVTTVYVTPNRTGSVQDDPGLRIVCAELCGAPHALMNLPVRVVEPAQFEAWIASARQ
jgi:cytochrome c oxidase subunit 2